MPRLAMIVKIHVPAENRDRMLVAALERGKRGDLGFAGLGELQTVSGRLPDAAMLDYAGAVGRQTFMPALGGLGEYAAPAKMLFKEPCVAEFFAAGGAEFYEKAAAFQTKFGKHEGVLSQLRLRVRNHF